MNDERDDHIVQQAANDYINGKIDIEEFGRIREKHGPDYASIFLAMERDLAPQWAAQQTITRRDESDGEGA